jgi:hypothetical protein
MSFRADASTDADNREECRRMVVSPTGEPARGAAVAAALADIAGNVQRRKARADEAAAAAAASRGEGGEPARAGRGAGSDSGVKRSRESHLFHWIHRGTAL